MECVTVVQGHPRSLIAAPVESAQRDFPLYLSLFIRTSAEEQKITHSRRKTNGQTQRQTESIQLQKTVKNSH